MLCSSLTFGSRQSHVGALSQPALACLQSLGDWGDGVADLLIAAICHHGRPQNETLAAAKWHERWWTARAGLNPRSGSEDLLTRCRSWFPGAFAPEGPRLPTAPGFGHAFAGLVMLADWIASDTTFFPFSAEGDGDRMVAREHLAGSVP